MNKKRTSSISHCKFSESSDDSEIDEIKEIRTNLSLLKKTLKKATNPRGQTPTPAKDKGSNTKDRPKSGKADKANISMFDLGKGSSEKNEKSGALKKKRSSVRPLKVHDISVSGPGVTQKQLQDDHILKVKVNNLEKSIVSQEKALRNIRKKLITEKSDLWGLKERISQKEKLEQEEMRQERSFAVESKNEGNEKERKRLSIVRKKNKENKGLSGDELDMSKYQRNYFSEKTAEFGYRERREEASLAQELEREREERKRISEMKEYIRDLTRKYEIEIEGIKASINIVSEENYKIRSNAISMKDQETIEIMYDKKIRELEEALAKKDREIAEKEGYYKGQIEDIQIKIEELQREVRRMAKCEDEAEELAQQLQLKDKEMYMSKKYYMDKLQTKIDEQTNQKKEWLIVYNGLLSDIRNLKGDLEGYENKKMNSNDSSGRLKEELSFTSSRRIGQGNY